MLFPQPAGAEPTTAAATMPWCSFGGYFIYSMDIAGFACSSVFLELIVFFLYGN